MERMRISITNDFEKKMGELAKNVMSTVYQTVCAEIYQTICAELTPHLQKMEQAINYLEGQLNMVSQYVVQSSNERMERGGGVSHDPPMEPPLTNQPQTRTP